jgi:hypothetical protein
MDAVLYDDKGHPVAYFEDDGERIIYLWSGYAVAYLVGEMIFGWNGHHVGWYYEGVVYDTRGQRVGSIGDKCPFALKEVRVKSAKHAKSPKFERRPEHKRPDFRRDYGSQNLEEFLKAAATV